jgi:hypothetical protein
VPGYKRLEPSKRAFRSSVSNGGAILAGVDGRSLVARRFRDIANAIAEDCGGSDNLTEAKLQLIRSAAGLAVLREDLDAKACNGQVIDVGCYTRITNSLGRVLALVGLERVPTDVTPSLKSYLVDGHAFLVNEEARS